MPQNPDALHLLGVAALQTGDAHESIRLIRAAIAVQPKHRVFHSSLAKALMEARRPEEALPAFKSAVRLAPGNPEHQMGVANCLALTGGLAEAESRLRRITQRFPDFALAWFNLVNAVRDQGRTAEALDCFRRALKLDDNLIETHTNLGGALLALIDDYVGVSNTNMYLRARAGRAARVLVPFPPSGAGWPRGIHRRGSPGFRVYRQKPDGDWSTAVERLRIDLLAALGSG